MRKGTKMTEESKQKMRDSKKGKHYSPQTEFKKGHDVWNKNKPHPRARKSSTMFKQGHKTNLGRVQSEATKEKIRQINKGKHLSPATEFRKGQVPLEIIKKSRLALCVRPNKPEKILIRLLRENNLPYKYTGDGSFWIENLNPDFVECNGKKKCIEVFGEYHHNPLLKKGLPWSRTQIGREEILKKYGWECLVIWDNELRNPEKVLEKVIDFEAK